jgi:hypothetical protein
MGPSLRREVARSRFEHGFDRRSLLTEVTLRFIDNYSNPDSWDDLLGSKSSEMWHRDLFGRRAFDGNSLPGVQTSEGRLVCMPEVKIECQAEDSTDHSRISEKDQKEIENESIEEITYLVHLITADRAIKQLFSVFVGYSFAAREGLVKELDKPIKMLEALLETSQTERCRIDGNYPTIKRAFDEMLAELNLSSKQWEAIAPAIIAVERLERSIMQDAAQRIATEILVNHFSDSAGSSSLT